jgi:hypothetical protein
MDTSVITPDVWGPSVWDTCYWTASGFCPERRDYYRTFFKILPYILRCNECNVNLQALVAARPVDPYLTSPEKLLEWVFLTHMDVRKHQRVRRTADYTLEDVLQRYLPKNKEQAAPVEVAAAVQNPRSAGRRRREGFAVRPSDEAASDTAQPADSVAIRRKRAPPVITNGVLQQPNARIPAPPIQTKCCKGRTNSSGTASLAV